MSSLTPTLVRPRQINCCLNKDCGLERMRKVNLFEFVCGGQPGRRHWFCADKHSSGLEAGQECPKCPSPLIRVASITWIQFTGDSTASSASVSSEVSPRSSSSKRPRSPSSTDSTASEVHALRIQVQLLNAKVQSLLEENQMLRSAQPVAPSSPVSSLSSNDCEQPTEYVENLFDTESLFGMMPVPENPFDDEKLQ